MTLQTRKLRQLLSDRFNQEELRTLCYDLQVDFDDLPGEGKTAKSRELVARLERRNRLNDLLDYLKQVRPDLWEELEATKPAPVRSFEDEITGLPGIVRWLFIFLGVVLVGLVGVWLFSTLGPSAPAPATRTPTWTPSRTPTTFVSTATPTVTPTPIPTTPTQTATPRPALPTQTPTPSFFFRDEFDGPSLGGHWSVSGPAVRLENGALRLNGSGGEYPLVFTTVDPFPANGRFALEIRFRYMTVTGWGIGLAAADSVPARGSFVDIDHRFLGIWQDVTGPLRMHSSGPRVYTGRTNDTEWHVIRLNYDGNQYELAVDGDQVYSSAIVTNKPTTLWFGNTETTSGNGEWPVLEVDYVRISSIE